MYMKNFKWQFLLTRYPLLRRILKFSNTRDERVLFKKFDNSRSYRGGISKIGLERSRVFCFKNKKNYIYFFVLKSIEKALKNHNCNVNKSFNINHYKKGNH